MSLCRIIGVGSPFADDRLGLELVTNLDTAALGRRFSLWEFEILQRDRPGPALLADLRGVEAALLVDAMQAGLAAGEMRVLDPAELPVEGRLSGHDMGLADSLRLADTLGELPPRLGLIGVQLCDPGIAGLQERFSALAEVELARILERAPVS